MFNLIKNYFCKSLTIHTLKAPQQVNLKKAYGLIDTSFDKFFKQRSFTTQSFNFLMQVHIHRKQFEHAKKTFDKMIGSGITPDQTTSLNLMRIAASQSDTDQTQKLFKQHLLQYGKNKKAYTTLIQAYGNARIHQPITKIIQQMQEEGIVVDLITYTAALKGFLRSHKIGACWKIYQQVINSKIQLDSLFYAKMIQVCAATHDSQRAINLMRKAQHLPQIQQLKNNYLKALARRPDYAQKAIQYFYQMSQQNNLSLQSFTHGISACASLGDVSQAFNILNIMKKKGFQSNKFILSQILKVYVTACSNPALQNDLRNQYVKDSWQVLSQIQNNESLTVYSLNYMLQLYTGMNSIKQAQQRILPMYDRLNIKHNSHTYQILMHSYKNQGSLDVVVRLWNIARQNKIPITYKQATVYLETGVKLSDIKMTVNALQQFKKMDMRPKIDLLSSISRIQNLPLQIHAQLMDYKQQFGILRQKTHIQKLEAKEKKVIQRAALRKDLSI